MTVFIDWLIRHGTPSLPAAEWRAEVGDETTAALEAARLVRRVALNVDDTYPCPSPTWPGCPRRIIEDRDGCLRAVCGDEGHCDDVRIPEDLAYQIEVEPGAFARGLSALMGLAPEGVGVPMGKVWPLGVRSIAARPR